MRQNRGLSLAGLGTVPYRILEHGSLLWPDSPAAIFRTELILFVVPALAEL